MRNLDIPYTIHRASDRIRLALGATERRVSDGFLRVDQAVERASERVGNWFEGRNAAV